MSKNENNIKQKVEIILASEFLTTPTRRTLIERLNKTGTPQFFDSENFLLLSIVCSLLLNQNFEEDMVEIALYIDQRLYANKSKGWRYDTQPLDPEAYSLGLKGVNVEAKYIYGKSFITLNRTEQIKILKNVQIGAVKSNSWGKINPQLFFEDLLTESAEIFFSHPSVQCSIDYVGMADAEGWKNLNLNQSEKLENL